jgi:hypothetical protein
MGGRAGDVATGSSAERAGQSLTEVYERASELNNLSVRLLGEGRTAEARRASAEAVDWYRRLSAATDADLRWHLATALITHSTNVAADEGAPGMTLASVVDDVAVLRGGFSNESLAAVKEGAEMLAHLYDEAPDRYRLDMVTALRSYALRLAQHGYRTRALAVAERGCRLSDQVTRSVHALVERSKVHLVWADLLIECSQPQAALRAADIAAGGFADLMAQAPQQFAAWYTKSLRSGAAALEADGDNAAAHARAQHVLELRLAGDGQPAAYDAEIDDVVALYVRTHYALPGARSPREEALAILDPGLPFTRRG